MNLSNTKINKPLLIIGGEGHGSVISSCIEDNRNRYNDLEWKVEGFINDFEESINGYPVFGGINKIQELSNKGFYFSWGIHMIGRNPLTRQTFDRANIPINKLATIVHKSAFISENVELSPGVFIMCNSYIAARTKLGIGTMVKSSVQIGHDVVCGPLCHFAMGSITGSYTKLGICADVAIGSIILESRQIGNYSMAGAGSLITHDIPDYEIHTGSPAKFMKRIKED